MTNSEIIEFFKNDRFAAMVGAVIEEITPEEVVCSLELCEHHMNAGNKVQGGAIFTLADFAFAVSCNYDDLVAGNNSITVGHSSNIVYFRPTAGKKLFAKSRAIQKGRKLSVYRITISDDEGCNIAEMTGNAYTVSLDKK